VADKTRQLLLKTQAKGKSSLPSKDRFHVSCVFRFGDGETQEAFVFVARTATLSELLEQVADRLPQLAFKAGVRPEGQCVVLATEDCDDWHVWDRRAVVSEALQEFESVRISPMSTAVVVANQTLLTAVKAAQTEAERISAEALLQVITDSEEQQSKEPEWFQPGDVLEYLQEEAECEVLAAHKDDFPNVYYTVRLLGSGREKQTVHSNLALLRPKEALSAEAGGMHLRVDWAGQSFGVRGADPAMSVAELKRYIRRWAPAGAGLRLGPSTKLVCKGSTLADTKVVSATKVKSGAKVMLIG
jgi:hypothetical protein